MTRFQIKICGITRPQDAALAARLGADMIGLVFYTKSSRYVKPAEAKTVCDALPPIVDRVGVFVNESIPRVLAVCERLHLAYAQLHGRETEKDIAVMQKHGFKVIKAFSVASMSDWDKLRRCTADLVMVDAGTAAQPGGTGKRCDWSLRPTKRIPNLVLAGGLSETNVREGVRLFKPLMIDVSSSLESKPGVKSAQKLKRFFAACDAVRYGRD